MKKFLIVLVVLMMTSCMEAMIETATDDVPKVGKEYKFSGGFESVTEKKPFFDTNSKYDETYYIIRDKETGVEYIYIPGASSRSAVLTRR